MLPQNIEAYSDLWKNVSRYLLAPFPSQESDYVIYMRMAYAPIAVVIVEELIRPVTERMIAAGVEVRSKPINKAEGDVEWILNERFHEFIIIDYGRGRRQYDIFHELSNSFLVIPDFSEKDYRKLAIQMIGKGVTLKKA